VIPTDVDSICIGDIRFWRGAFDVSDETLKVDPAALTSAATAFNQAGAQLAGLGADGPLGEAAAGVPQLVTAGACRQAQSAVAAATTAAAEAVNVYGSSLDSAASQYEAQDQAAAGSINKVEVPGG
jgi:hypothetical protein